MKLEVSSPYSEGIKSLVPASEAASTIELVRWMSELEKQQMTASEFLRYCLKLGFGKVSLNVIYF